MPGMPDYQSSPDCGETLSEEKVMHLLSNHASGAMLPRPRHAACCCREDEVFTATLQKMEIVRKDGRKMMPGKLQFDHQKHRIKEKKQKKKKQKESPSKALRDTNTGKLVRCNSKEHLNPDFSRDPVRAVEIHSDAREGRGQDEEITVHSM